MLWPSGLEWYGSISRRASIVRLELLYVIVSSRRLRPHKLCFPSCSRSGWLGRKDRFLPNLELVKHNVRWPLWPARLGQTFGDMPKRWRQILGFYKSIRRSKIAGNRFQTLKTCPRLRIGPKKLLKIASRGSKISRNRFFQAPNSLEAPWRRAEHLSLSLDWLGSATWAAWHELNPKTAQRSSSRTARRGSKNLDY